MQANGLSLLYLTEIANHVPPGIGSGESSAPQGIFDGEPLVLERDVVDLSPALQLLPATFKFRAAASAVDSVTRTTLQDAIRTARSLDYDYVFLDAQAGADVYSRIAMGRDLCDEVIIISEYDPLSAAGVERLKAAAAEDLDFTRTWVLINKMLPDFVDSYSDFLEVTRYLSPIPWDAYATAKMQLTRIRNQRSFRVGATAVLNMVGYGIATSVSLAAVLWALLLSDDSAPPELGYVVVLLLVVLVVLMGLRGRLGIDSEEDKRLLNEMQQWEEKVGRLDVLRKADLKTLLKAKG